MMSWAVMSTSTARRKATVSKLPSSLRYLRRLSEARLQALSSRCMYSLQGLEALILPEFGQVCQALIVVSNCIPGSPHSQVACAIMCKGSRARYVSQIWPVVTKRLCQGASSITACMNSSVTRTELLAFWKKIELYAVPSMDPPYPACMSAQAFFSSSALQRMNSTMSGWSALSTTILAARRVLPPLLITPAEASAARMKETGPEASPPPESRSRDERIPARLIPEPEPPLKMMPSRRYQSRIDSIVSSTEMMKQADACGCGSTPTLNHTGLLK